MYKLRTINISQHMALPEISSNMQQCLIIYPGKKGSNVCEGINISCTYQRWTPALPKPIPAKALARCMLALASRSSGFLMALHNMETMVPVNSHMEMVENQDREGKEQFLYRFRKNLPDKLREKCWKWDQFVTSAKEQSWSEDQTASVKAISFHFAKTE